MLIAVNVNGSIGSSCTLMCILHNLLIHYPTQPQLMYLVVSAKCGKDSEFQEESGLRVL